MTNQYHTSRTVSAWPIPTHETPTTAVACGPLGQESKGRDETKKKNQNTLAKTVEKTVGIRRRTHLQLLGLGGVTLHVLADLPDHLLEVLVELQQPAHLVGVCPAPSCYPEKPALALGQVHLFHLCLFVKTRNN